MRQLTRTVSTKPISRGLQQRAASKLQVPRSQLIGSVSLQSRCFSVSRPASLGLQPDTEDPKPKESEPVHHLKDPTPISDEEFHERAEALLEEICAKMEAMQESRDDIDAEYSVCFPKVLLSHRLFLCHHRRLIVYGP